MRRPCGTICRMAIGWLTVLKTVPWADVIGNAPKIAEGAKRLWKAVPGRSADADQAGTAATGDGAAEVLPQGLDVDAVRAQFAAIEAQVSELQVQMRASSELINALAEQNTRLVEQAEATRLRVVYLTAAMIVVALVAVAGLVAAIVR